MNEDPRCSQKTFAGVAMGQHEPVCHLRLCRCKGPLQKTMAIPKFSRSDAQEHIAKRGLLNVIAAVCNGRL